MTTVYLMMGVVVLSLVIGLLVHYQLTAKQTAVKEPVTQEKEEKKEQSVSFWGALLYSFVKQC